MHRVRVLCLDSLSMYLCICLVVFRCVDLLYLLIYILVYFVCYFFQSLFLYLVRPPALSLFLEFDRPSFMYFLIYLVISFFRYLFVYASRYVFFLSSCLYVVLYVCR